MGISKHVSFIIFLLTNHPLLIQPLPNQPNTNPSPPPTTHHINTSNPPDIAIIAGILTTIFSITFLLLLYMKHCKKPENYATTYTNHHHAPSRVNSGLNRKLILSLPTFRFSSLKGQKDGLECAVCLSIFEPNEVLRLLPKCKHAFHVECVDTWLDAHSTCPLCRYRVDPEDALLIDYHNHQSNQTTPRNSNKGKDSFTNPRVSGRHSYACERSNTNPVPVFLGRSSLDSYKMKMKLSRKDGLLPVTKAEKVQHKVEHRIIVGDEEEETEEMRRWSNVQRSELLYLEMEMILEGNGSKVISGRSVSEIVGVSRCNKLDSSNNNNGEREEEKAVKRWLAWISQSQHKNNNTTTTAVLQQTTSTCSSDASSIVV